MARILVIDDEESICWGLARLARRRGDSADVAASAEQGLALARQRAPDVIFLDVRLPGVDGITAMPQIRATAADAPIVVMTAHGDLDTAVQAVREGAFEYLLKPFDLEVASRTIERALDHRAARESSPPPGDFQPDDEFVGRSLAMQQVFRQIALVSHSDACVHIVGESGVGKELVARAIHRHSFRAHAPFVPVHVASLNPSVAESELFGHVQGAFTGADRPRKGLLEQAHGGTVFLDEVGDIPRPIQVKLLRALELGEIYPVGSPTPIRCDFRLVSATNCDLRARVADGSFRADLYYRLVTFEIGIPPLRERLEDVEDLAHHFLGVLAAQNRRTPPGVSPEALAELKNRPWYGNVRELRNALERALILAGGGPVSPEHLPPPAPAPAANAPDIEQALSEQVARWARQQLAGEDATDLYDRLLKVIEPPLFEEVLGHNQRQFAAAAKQLGLHRTTLRKKVRDDPPAGSPGDPRPDSD